MHLSLTITREEIQRLSADLTPLRIDLGRKRTVSFGRPASVELVAEQGVRLRGDAKLAWEVAGVPLPLAVRIWQILLVPAVVQRDDRLVLAFDPILEALDFKHVPGFFDERVTDAINEGIAAQRRRLAWDITRALGVEWPLPARVVSGGVLELSPASVDVAVEPDVLRIAIQLGARVGGERTIPASLRSA